MSQLGKTIPEFLGGSLRDHGGWMRLLVEIGAIVAYEDPQGPITIALCVPRVEYAGLLTAMGAGMRFAMAPNVVDWRLGVEKLIGHRVVYSYTGNPHVFWEGLLCETDGESRRVKIQVSTGEDFDCLDFDEVHCLRSDGERQDCPLEERMHGKGAFSDAYSIRLEAALTRRYVGELCCSGARISLVGTKSRIHEELHERLPLRMTDGAECSFCDLLRPVHLVKDSAILEVLSPNDEKDSDHDGLVLIEGSRRLAEHLTASKGCNRVIFLGRNEAHYADAADTVTRLWQQRDAEVDAGLSVPDHIKLRMFR